MNDREKELLLYKLLESGLKRGPISSRSKGRIEDRLVIENRFTELSTINPVDESIISVINSGKFSG
jgi:hypothetical protein